MLNSEDAQYGRAVALNRLRAAVLPPNSGHGDCALTNAVQAAAVEVDARGKPTDLVRLYYDARNGIMVRLSSASSGISCLAWLGHCPCTEFGVREQSEKKPFLSFFVD